MEEVVREEGELVELSNGHDTKNLIEGESIGLREMAESNSTALRNNSNQLNFPSSSLTPLPSRESTPRRRPTPRSASPIQQYSIRMSLSPRSNSVYEESPDTTFENAGTGSTSVNRADRKARSRDGSEEMELDYGESDQENEVGEDKAKVYASRLGSNDDQSEIGSGKGTRNSDSPQARQHQSPSSYIASPWQRQRSLSSPRPRSPSPISARRNEPSLSPPPHSASYSPDTSRSIPLQHLATTCSSQPPLIRLHMCLPRDLPSSTFSNYFDSLSPPLQIYDQELYTAQHATMGFIVVKRELWESGEIERRVRRRGEMEFGFRGNRSWGIKLTVARDQSFSSNKSAMKRGRSSSLHSRQAPPSSDANVQRSPSPRRRNNHSPDPFDRYKPSPTQSASSLANSRFLPPPRPTPTSNPTPQLIKLYLPLPSYLPSSTLLHYFSSLSPPLPIHSHSLHTDRSSAFGFILVSRTLWENGEINKSVRAKGGIWLGRGQGEWNVKLSVARDQVDHCHPEEQVKEFEVWHPKHQSIERGRGREDEVIGLVLEGFGRSTRLSEVEEMLRGSLRFWESLVLEDVGDGIRVRLEVRGEVAAMIVEREFDGISFGHQRITVRRVNQGEGRLIGVQSGRRTEGETRSREFGVEEVERDEKRRKSRDRRRSRSRSRDRHGGRAEGSLRSKRSRKEEEEGAEEDARIEKKRRRKSEHKATRDSPRQRRSRGHSSSRHSRNSRHYQRSPSPARRSRRRPKSRSISPASHRRNRSPVRSHSPDRIQPSHSSSHRRYSTSSRKIIASPESLPRNSSPDPFKPDPRHWREDTPILRSSPSTSRVPLPRPPTPIQPRASDSQSFQSSANRSLPHTSSNRPQLFRPVAVRPWEAQSHSSQYPRAEDRWARNGWNQVGREQIARETREREESWNRRNEW